MEQKLESLATLLATFQENVVDSTTDETQPHETDTASSDSSTTDSLLNNTSSRQDYIASCMPLPVAAAAFPHISASSLPYPTARFSEFVFDIIDDPISKDVLCLAKAEGFLATFAERPFPWVRLPKNASVETLRRERPFLLLSVLTFASYEDVRLQRQLETELKDSLMKKVIVQGEKSLDLLQGLLVYLAWYTCSLLNI